MGEYTTQEALDELKQINDEIRKAHLAHGEAMRILNRRLWELMQKCPHTSVTRYTDIYESSYVCQICGKESSKKFGTNL